MQDYWTYTGCALGTVGGNTPQTWSATLTKHLHAIKKPLPPVKPP
jgi:hypothetical protein